MNLSSSKNWKTVRLGDIAEIRRGSSPRPIQDFLSDSGMPWVKISDATADKTRYIQTTKQFIKEEGIKNTVIVHEGDFIVSNSATPGLPKFMKITAGVHDGWLIIKPDEKVIDKLFLYYQMLFDRVRLVSQASGAVFDNLKTDTLKDHEFPLPSLDEQREISRIMGSFDDKIELLRNENKTLENISRTLFKEWFIDFNFPGSTGKMIDSELGETPEDWSVYELRDVFDFIKGKKPLEVSEIKKDGFLPQILIENMNGVKSIYAKNEKVIVCDEFNLLMVMDGASSGRIEFGNSGVVGSTLSKLEFKKPIKAIIYFYLKSLEENIKENTTGSAIPHTDKEKIYMLKIALPKESTEYEQVFESFMQKMILSRKEIQTLSKLRDELLNKIFN